MARTLTRTPLKKGKRKPAPKESITIDVELAGDEVFDTPSDVFDFQSIISSMGTAEAQPLIESAHFEITEEEVEGGPAGPAEEQDLSEYLQALDDPFRFEEALRASDLGYFAATTLRGDPTPPYNGEFLVSEHHEEWSDLVSDHKRLNVLAPRDHGKTYFFDFAYPIWMATKHPGRDGFIFSATQTQAQRILRDIREEIEDNPALQYLVPGKKERWNDSELKLANGHTIYARGFGTKVRGAHPVWIVCDDILNDESAYSEVQRKKQKDYFFSAVVPMCVPGGQIIVVGTPFHSQDLYAEIQEKPAWFFKRYQALFKDENGEDRALWPERYSLEYLYWKRDEDVGPIRFAREYLCQPISDDMSLFPSWLFQGKPTEQVQLKLGMDRSFWNKLDVEIYQGIDLAISATAKSDYMVIFTMALDPRGNRYVVDIERFHGISYRAQKSKINASARRWRPALIFIESNQMQQIYGQELRVETDLPIKDFHTGAQKHNLEKGLPSIRTLLENGKFRIPRGDARSVEVTEQWIAELNSFTFDGGKVVSVGEHDDIAMACWICDQAIRTGAAFIATFGIEDTFTPREKKKAKKGELELPTPTEQLRKELQPTEDEDAEEILDPFTGEPLNANGDPVDWRPKEGAPSPSAFGIPGKITY